MQVQPQQHSGSQIGVSSPGSSAARTHMQVWHAATEHGWAARRAAEAAGRSRQRHGEYLPAVAATFGGRDIMLLCMSSIWYSQTSSSVARYF